MRNLNMQKFRSSRLQIFFKIGALKNFANFTGKHLCWSLILLKPTTLLISDSNIRCFPVKFGKFLRTHSGDCFCITHVRFKLSWYSDKLLVCNLLKKRLWHRCLPVSLSKFLRTPFLQNTSVWLPLVIQTEI